MNIEDLMNTIEEEILEDGAGRCQDGPVHTPHLAFHTHCCICEQLLLKDGIDVCSYIIPVAAEIGSIHCWPAALCIGHFLQAVGEERHHHYPACAQTYIAHTCCQHKT